MDPTPAPKNRSGAKLNDAKIILSSFFLLSIFFPWFLRTFMRNLTMSRGARLLVVGKIQGYEVPASTTESAAVLFRIEVTE